MENITFKDLNLCPEVEKAVAELGFESPTPIQAKTIPVILDGRDVIGQAQTGTGKTAAFGLPMIEKIDTHSKSIQALILCPTRELAIQVSEEIRKFSSHKRGIFALPIYGGQSMDRQLTALRKGVQIVIGTPGRVIDHLDRKTLNFSNLKMVVLDEADKMLDMGFKEDIENILARTPEDRQTVLFSATMPQEILNIVHRFQRDPVIIKIEQKQLTVPSIDQSYIELRESMKVEALCRLIDIHNPKLSLVFCNTKKMVDELVDHLQARGYFSDGLHGDMKQMQRDRIMKAFRNEKIQVLVATDVAARGLDVDDVEIVFNYDAPKDNEDYIHRIGRTGRAGKKGKSFTFVAGKEIYRIRDIQRYAKTTLNRIPVPTLAEVEGVKNSQTFQKIKETVDEGKLDKYISQIEKLLADDLTSIDIAAALLKLLNEKNSGNKEDGQGADEFSSQNVRLFVNAGRAQSISPRNIVEAISVQAGIPSNLVGDIDIYDQYSFVEVPKDAARDILSSMKNFRIRGRNIRMEIASKKEQK